MALRGGLLLGHWGLVSIVLLFFSVGASGQGFSHGDLVGKSFAYSGPNCFSTALVASGVQATFRGVSEREFKKDLFNNCSEVKNVNSGDMGVYFSPDGSLALHAFIYLDEKTVLEKRGVHFGANNAIQISLMSQSRSIYGQDHFCLRYSSGPECYNSLRYFKCHSIAVSNRYESEIENLFEQVLEGELMGASEVAAVNQLGELIEDIAVTRRTSPERLYSYKKQLEYLHQRTQRL